MSNIDYQQLIKESAAELRSRLKALSHRKLRARCEVLLWLKQGQVSSMRQAVLLKGLSTNQGSRWWKQYQALGIEGFLSLGYRPQVSPLSDKQGFIEQLNTTGFSTIKEAQVWLAEQYGLVYTENGLGNYFRKHKIKLKTGRPHHPKKDEKQREAYKKNMRRS